MFQTPSPFPFSIYKNMTYGLKYYGKTGRKELESAVIEDMLSEMKKDYSIVIVTHNIAQAKRIAARSCGDIRWQANRERISS